MAEYLPSIIQGAINAALFTTVAGFIGMCFWWWKKRIEKREAKGPVLYVLEHEEMCYQERVQSDQVIATLINETKRHTKATEDGFKDIKGDITGMHRRLDKHLENELKEKRKVSNA